ncbi:hypothetical protein [Nocardia sp. NPDC050175]|uniref:hypothetical protein n=1 Tax=Nocardia sp. NPDC050175 TaxID=3364317 RepID=UPI0037876936
MKGRYAPQSRALISPPRPKLPAIQYAPEQNVRSTWIAQPTTLPVPAAGDRRRARNSLPRTELPAISCAAGENVRGGGSERAEVAR